MTFLEKKIINILSDLKENHHVTGIKVEFEDEGTSFEEAFLLKEILDKIGLNLTVKIGGCGAINDINQAKKLGANTIVAPMIESSYALKKFVESVKSVYSEQKPELFVNIETINGTEKFDEIFSLPESKEISGIVIGRFDMAKSIGLGCKDCNGEKIFGIVNDLAIKTKGLDKLFAIGGGICAESIKFFNKITAPLHRYETRKIIFDANHKNLEGIDKAIEFEIEWIKYRQEAFNIIKNNDEKRINSLKSRCQNIMLK